MPPCRSAVTPIGWRAPRSATRSSAPNCQGAKRCARNWRLSTRKFYKTYSSGSIWRDGVEPVKLPASEQQVGVDVGLKTFAYLSDGTTIENPRFFREEQKHLAKAQRKLSKAQKGTPE